MIRFECTVIVSEKCIVEFHENVCNEEWLNSFKQKEGNILSLAEHAKIIAESRARNGVTFIENYGVPRSNGMKPWFVEQKDLNDAINVRDCEESSVVVEVCEVQEEDRA